MAGRSDKQPVMGTWDTATTRDNSETLIVDSIMEIINQVVAPEGRSDEWYRRAVAAIDKHVSEEYEKVSAYGSSILMASRSVAIGSVRSKASSIEEYLNKPLPPLPPKPYFEYMFADAGSRKDRPEPPSKVFLKPMGNARDHHGVAIPTARMDVITATNNPKQNGALDPYPQQTNVQAGLINAPAAQYPHTITLRTVNKRSAWDSFVTDSTANGPDGTDSNIGLLSSKKIRVVEKQGEHDVRSMRAVSVYSNPHDTNSSDHLVENRAVPWGMRPKRTTAALTGYPGQFESYEAGHLRRRAARNQDNRIHFTCGDPTHANHEFTHTNFLADPTFPSTDYTKEMLGQLPVRSMALTHAEHESSLAARLLTRTGSEENLRREAHRECAAARLEGVAVGQYRYYQGHMSLEEYKAARMCVCWDSCWCTKLCTIYGDVLCPCTEWLALHKD